MRPLDRNSLAHQIVERLNARRDKLEPQWQHDPIANMHVDELFSVQTAHALFSAFPGIERMLARKSLRESRYIGEQVDSYHPLLREAAHAFQHPHVVQAISEMTHVCGLVAESRPGVCGISRMDRGQFLNPHVDRSRDDMRGNQQVISLLYYVTPDLRLADGGHLELWHSGPEGEATTILSKFNRLVIMATHGAAWHSVSPVRSARHRCCLWTYYYAPYSAPPQNDNHVAAFRGRPEQKLRDLLLRADTFARQSLHRLVLERGLMSPRAYLASGDTAANPAVTPFDEPRYASSNDQINRGG